MKKLIIFTVIALLFLSGLSAYQYVQFHDNKLHVIFCDVGQGDAIYIKTPNNMHLLIDAGPDQKVLSCLSRHSPFWERTLDLVLLTHPHADHYSGLYYIFDRYSIKSFDTEEYTYKASGVQELRNVIVQKHIPTKMVVSGDRWKIGDGLKVSLEGPVQEWLTKISYLGSDIGSTENASLITQVSYGSFHLLLTGDAQVEELLPSLDHLTAHITVLQIPHHGSSTGTNPDTLKKVSPDLAVISVGAQNRYGLPNKNVLQMLVSQGVHALRTDKAGDIEIVSDGKGWKVEE